MKPYQKSDLLEAVEESYLENEGTLSQKELYHSVAQKLKITPSEHYGKVGNQDKVNLFFRDCRWIQQSLRNKKLLKRVDKGVWEVTGKAKNKLHMIKEANSILGMSTDLGIMIWSKSESVFSKEVIKEDIDLVLTSPPYILQTARNYGGVQEEKQWVEFIMNIMEKIIPRLADGASVALNIGQDSFEKGLPARQTHVERLTLALRDAGLHLVDRIVWQSNKAPTPTAYTSVERFMLKASYEFILHFTNNPLALKSNNQRVLLPHTKEYKRFVSSGGTKIAANNSDGSHRKYVGDYSNVDLEKGKLASNVVYFANKCVRNEAVNRFAREKGWPTHGAKMPFRLAKFLVEYMCPVGGLVVDPFGGTGTSADASQETGRRWICIEAIKEYVQQSFIRFKNLGNEAWFNPALAA